MAEPSKIDQLRILNLGAGVQSTTLALMAFNNWFTWSCSEPIPYPAVGFIDHAIFADTQDEPSSVYAHLEWLTKSVGGFFPIHVRTAGSLGNQLINGIDADGKRSVSIPAFTAQIEGTKSGVLWRQCTAEYKVKVIEKCIREELLHLDRGRKAPAETKIAQVFGLSHDEAGRIIRVKAAHPWWSEAFFPLFEMEMTRAGCVAWLKKQDIPHEVPRSACVYCPYKSDKEWRLLRENDPAGWKRAIEIDYALRDREKHLAQQFRQTLYLHSSCVPIDKANFDAPETKERKKGQEMFGFLNECAGYCGV